MLICICIWIITVNLAIANPIAKPTESEMQSLETKLRYPCGGNGDATKQDLTPSDVKDKFNAILLESRSALNEAEIDIRAYVSIFYTLISSLHLSFPC